MLFIERREDAAPLMTKVTSLRRTMKMKARADFLQLSKNVSVNYLRNIGKHIRKKPILHHRA